MLTICINFAVFLKMRPHFIEFPFYREKVASQKWLRSPFYRIPILSRAYCSSISDVFGNIMDRSGTQKCSEIFVL